MKFLKNFIKNLGLLLLIGLVLYIVFPTQMNQIFQLYGALFGPLILLFVIAAALPRKSRRRRW